MTCKDCIHVDVCMDTAQHYKQVFFDDEYCENFKDRSKFIKLLCNVGDVIYIPQRKRISVHKVISFYIGLGNTVLINLIPIEGYLVSCLNVDDIGKKAFLTSEECEQALKRCDNNE